VTNVPKVLQIIHRITTQHPRLPSWTVGLCRSDS